MSKPGKKKPLPFVKYYTGLSYMFSPSETRFILHMADIEFKRECGYCTDWTRADYMKVMGLSEYTFDKCVDRMIRLELLSRIYNADGNKVFYTFNMELYERLVEILGATCNIDRLIIFCRKNFIDNCRPISGITIEEIEELRSNSCVETIHPSMYRGK